MSLYVYFLLISQYRLLFFIQYPTQQRVVVSIYWFPQYKTVNIALWQLFALLPLQSSFETLPSGGYFKIAASLIKPSTHPFAPHNIHFKLNELWLNYWTMLFISVSNMHQHLNGAKVLFKIISINQFQVIIVFYNIQDCNCCCHNNSIQVFTSFNSV